jgi:hypothetical protein
MELLAGRDPEELRQLLDPVWVSLLSEGYLQAGRLEEANTPAL